MTNALAFDEQKGQSARLLSPPESAASPPLHVARTAKRVLVLEFDLFKSVGGGQTTYRKLIESFPENDYYYFILDEDPKTHGPRNAHPIPYIEHYHANVGDLPDEMSHFYYTYFQCWQLAASVLDALGPCAFDVVDAPDYHTLGLFIRGALEHHNIRVGAVALALHGTISSALIDQWPRRTAPRRRLAELRLREHLQYRAADVRYALSEAYGAHWKAYTGHDVRLLDPLLVIGSFAPTAAAHTSGPPDLLFIGRRERRKGPDLFVDLAWSLDRDCIGKILLIGEDSEGDTGSDASSIIGPMMRMRRCPVDFSDSLPPQALDKHFRSRSIVVLPSRYDQFNLIALEALRTGCPAFVSRAAGVADWILKYYPELSHLVIDIDCSRSGSDAIRGAVADYNAFRSQIVDVLTKRPPSPRGEDLFFLYEPNAATDRTARHAIAEICHRFDSFSRPRELSDLVWQARKTVARQIPMRIRQDLKATVSTTRRSIREFHPRLWLRSKLGAIVSRLLVRRGLLSEANIREIGRMPVVEQLRTHLLKHSERTSKEVNDKLTAASQKIAEARTSRVPIFRDMARLERKRPGGDLNAATYCLRIMRWLGKDAFQDLDFVVEALRSHNYPKEAEVAAAMYGDPKTAEPRCRALLDAQFREHLTKPDLPFELLNDRRGRGDPQVAVIVSLYNAEKKLATLLHGLRTQSLAKSGKLEIVLVDSGSPTREYEAFKAFVAEHSLPVVYARSANRETIQAAWNRGIKLARAPYLSFLGVDEGLHPDCLAILANELDRQPEIDWAMADSIVTEVDRHGIYAAEVMPYDRTGYDQGLVYLETCYLSWVGGLYRKSIHDRFGYYDETFRAAGDTEFKGRVLTHIKTLHVPKLLGVFNNYPEERTTQHPRAEIEDLRAWYLHRTPAGVAYTFDAHPAAKAEDLFRRCLGYRKSYCGHTSTDFDMAASIATYLAQRKESGRFADNAVQTAQALLKAAHTCETIDLRLKIQQRQIQLASTLIGLKRREERDKNTFGLTMRPQYHLFNDNRFEQHWWSWSA